MWSIILIVNDIKWLVPHIKTIEGYKNLFFVNDMKMNNTKFILMFLFYLKYAFFFSLSGT